MRYKGLSDLILSIGKSISASQTFLFSHSTDVNILYVMTEYEKKKKKLWDC